MRTAPPAASETVTLNQSLWISHSESVTRNQSLRTLPSFSPGALSPATLCPVLRVLGLGADDVVIADGVQEGVGLGGAELAWKYQEFILFKLASYKI